MFLRSIHVSCLTGPRNSPQFHFNNGGNCAGHYLWSRFRKWRIPTEGFNAIILQDDPHLPEEHRRPRISEHGKSFLMPFSFDTIAWEGMTPEQRHENYLSLFEHGFRVTAEHHPLPLEKLLALIDDFRAGGYLNQWITKKLIRRPNPADVTLRVELHAEITLERFTLQLRVYAGDELRHEEPLLDRNPDPICWYYWWKSIERDGDDLLLTNRRHKGEYLRRIPLATFR